MSVRRVVAGLLAAVAAGSSLLCAAPASAATSAIDFSRDGSSWSSTLSGSLYGDLLLVPSTAVTRSFYIRNNASEAGYLRLTLRDVVTDNLDFAGAMSLRADLTGWPGETVSLTSARPCARLSEGPVIAQGGVARVDMTALLGDLDGLRGQNGGAQFQVVVSLSGQPLGLGTSGCPRSGSEIAGFTPSTFRGSGFAGSSPAVFFSSPAGWIPTTWMPGTGWVPVDPSTGTPLPTTPRGTGGIRVAVNTSRFFQEYDVALWLVAALLGAGAAWTVLRRRSAPSTDQAAPGRGPDQIGAQR